MDPETPWLLWNMWGRLAQPCYKYQVLNVPLKGWNKVVSPSCVTGESAPEAPFWLFQQDRAFSFPALSCPSRENDAVCSYLRLADADRIEPEPPFQNVYPS